MAVDWSDITGLVPHRAPMLLLDRVLSADQTSLNAEVEITDDSMFFDAITRQVGAWIGIEYMAQAIAALEGYRSLQRGEPVQVGFLLGTRHYETTCVGFNEGARLRVTVQQTLMHDNGLAAFECQIVDLAEVADFADAGAESPVLARAMVTVFKPNDAAQFLSTSEQH